MKILNKKGEGIKILSKKGGMKMLGKKEEGMRKYHTEEWCILYLTGLKLHQSGASLFSDISECVEQRIWSVTPPVWGLFVFRHQ